jgi:hypothetical protein
VVIETCAKYPGGPTRMTATDVQGTREKRGGFSHQYPYGTDIRTYIHTRTYIYYYILIRYGTLPVQLKYGTGTVL